MPPPPTACVPQVCLRPDSTGRKLYMSLPQPVPCLQTWVLKKKIFFFS